MYLLLCYDIVNDSRRARLFRNLRGFLEPVQKSVFEGELSSFRYPQLLKLVRENIDFETDTVRIYNLCKGCRNLTELFGTAEELPVEPEDVII